MYAPLLTNHVAHHTRRHCGEQDTAAAYQDVEAALARGAGDIPRLPRPAGLAIVKLVAQGEEHANVSKIAEEGREKPLCGILHGKCRHGGGHPMIGLQAQCTSVYVVTDVMCAIEEGVNCLLPLKKQVWRRGNGHGVVDFVVPDEMKKKED